MRAYFERDRKREMECDGGFQLHAARADKEGSRSSLAAFLAILDQHSKSFVFT
jgi:hypothetical protein